MRDFAISDHPGVQAQLNRLAALSLPRGRLSLEPTRELLTRLGEPHRNLAPVFHVAGTNGKGSTCAFLRAALEAAGYRVHVYTSPHLVRFNERIRIADRLIEDDDLAELLREVLDAAGDLGVSFFEATTAAAFLAFARTPADACIVEVGLGGRLDATNVIERPIVCGIASLGLDHEAFLLAPEPGAPDDPVARIAWEKAGIAKPAVPLVTFDYPEAATRAIAQVAEQVGAPQYPAQRAWSYEIMDGQVRYRDDAELTAPRPSLPGLHQVANYALAIAMLRQQSALDVPHSAIRAAASSARWPARLQRLGPGPLTALVPCRTVWLDGGHNADAGEALAAFFRIRSARASTGSAWAGGGDQNTSARTKAVEGRTLHLILGMLANKDPRAIVEPLAGTLLTITAIPVPGHESHGPEVFGALARELGLPFGAAQDVTSALSALPSGNDDVLIAGSLYLAGEVLKANDEAPD